MNTTAQLIAAGIGLSGLTFATGGVSASPASATSATCHLTVTSNKVLDLQDRDGDDEIFFKLGGQKTPVRVYAQGQKRVNIGSKFFQNSIDVKIFERDGNNLTLVGSINNIPCQNEPGEHEEVSGAGALYSVRWSVD